MNARITRYCGFLIAVCAVLMPACAQAQEANSAAIQGTICDSQGAPLANATVSLQSADLSRNLLAHSDSQGLYRFQSLPPGTYTLSATMAGYIDGKNGPIAIDSKETKAIDLHLSKTNSVPGAEGASRAIQFSDEPKFQIAGITDPTSYGGHGSDIGVRTKEALARDADSLKEEPSTVVDSSESGTSANLHRHRGDADEAEGRPLDAVHEYQLAAEMQPSESNLFAWGAELLLHRAFDPAIEVFSKGQRLFPRSVRIAVGLSIATYDRGDAERGEQLLLDACDLDPADPTPYLFMGRLQEGEKTVSATWVEKLHRFATMHPENASAHYDYAVALSKPGVGVDRAVVKSELERAIQLDPKLGKAYLQLGILFAEKKEPPAAIAAFKKAIELLTLPDEAHYRLAQIYRQNGEMEKARQEIQLYHETSQEKTKQEEEQRHEIQQFVYTLREQKSDLKSRPQ